MSDLTVLLRAGLPDGSTVPDSDTAALAALYPYPDSVSGGDARPWVRANMVSSVDGASAGDDGRSASVSSDVDKAVFRLLRGLADVVLVGAGTARAEGYGPASPHPDLARSRRDAGRREAAVVVQVSRSGTVETGRGMFDGDGGLVLMAAGDDEALARARTSAGADRVLVAGHVDDGGVDLADGLAQLASRGLTRVLCEGGPSLLGRLVADDLLDELCLTTSPTLVSSDADRVVTGPGVDGRDLVCEGLLHADATLLARWVRRR